MRVFGVLVLCMLAASASAEEGFHSTPDGLPKAVAAYWDSVFVLLPIADGEQGSAVLIASEDNGDQRFLYLLTVNHVVEPNCGDKLGYCAIKVTASGGAKIAADGTARDIDISKPTRTVLKAEVRARSKTADISLLKISVPNSISWQLKPVPIARECRRTVEQRIYLIGYPETYIRTASKMLPIEDKYTLKRRWSTGLTISATVPGWNEAPETTADSLHGNSGGPAINSSGELVGLIIGGPEIKKNGYVGSEDGERPVGESDLISCPVIRNFLSGIIASLQ